MLAFSLISRYDIFVADSQGFNLFTPMTIVCHAKQ